MHTGTAILHTQHVHASFQCVVNLHHAQGIRRQRITQAYKNIHIDIKLIGLFVPNTVPAPPHNRAFIGIRLTREEFLFVHDGAGKYLALSITGIAFKGNFVFLANLRVFR